MTTLASDIALYLAGTGIGLSVGSTGNLLASPLSDVAPQAVASVVEYGGMPNTRAFGASLGSPVCETRRFQVLVRDISDNFGTTLTLAKTIHDKLDHLGETTLSGTRYLNVRSLGPPSYIGQDLNDRHLFSANYEAMRER